MDSIIELLSFPFIQKALICGIIISACAAILGVILVLKQYSLIGHGLADVGFGSLALALALGLPPLAVSIPMVIIVSFFIMMYGQKKGLGGDAAIGIMSTSFLAFGIIITKISGGVNKDIVDYMFGSILSVTTADVVASVVLGILVLIMFVLFYNRLFLITYDENYAKAAGINVSLYQFMISFMTALTVVMGMKMMGTLLISSLIIFPAISARKICKGFKSLVVVSALISVICFILGILISFAFELPTGASIALSNIAVMIAVNIFSPSKQKFLDFM